MSSETFDTIVVGARCAGAPLATWLARAGQRVLLLDSDVLPSDQPISTHFMHAVGVDWLDELGVGDSVRRLAPASPVVRLQLLDTPLDVVYPRGRAGYCLRRGELDRVLQDAAVAAGADLRTQTQVVGLLRNRDRVTGVEAVSGGQTRHYRARVVVGADGRNSSVAKFAGAREYLGYDNPRFAYWAYWPAAAAWKQDPELAGVDAFINLAGDKIARFVFQADGDLLVIGATAPLTHAAGWRGDFEAAYLRALQALPATAKLVEGNRREGKLIGIKKMRFFFREAAGPGFALVGDAGLHKDPTPGFGITDALRDARNLARAIICGGDDALYAYHRQRDLDSFDLFHFAKQLGDPAYINPLNHLVFQRVAASPTLMARLAGSLDRESSPLELVPVSQLLRWVAGSALRGRTGSLRQLFALAPQQARLERARRTVLGRNAEVQPAVT